MQECFLDKAWEKVTSLIHIRMTSYIRYVVIAYIQTFMHTYIHVIHTYIDLYTRIPKYIKTKSMFNKFLLAHLYESYLYLFGLLTGLHTYMWHMWHQYIIFMNIANDVNMVIWFVCVKFTEQKLGCALLCLPALLKEKISCWMSLNEVVIKTVCKITYTILIQWHWLQ